MFIQVDIILKPEGVDYVCFPLIAIICQYIADNLATCYICLLLLEGMVSAHSKQSLLKGILVVYLISFGAHCSALNCVDCGTEDAEVM